MHYSPAAAAAAAAAAAEGDLAADLAVADAGGGLAAENAEGDLAAGLCVTDLVLRTTSPAAAVPPHSLL